MPPDPTPWLELYRNYGTAGLFLVMYLVTIFTFIKFLREQIKNREDNIRQVADAFARAAQVADDNKKLCEGIKVMTEAKMRQDSEFMAFLKGRDSVDR
jgi:hypothetical protein